MAFASKATHSELSGVSPAYVIHSDDDFHGTFEESGHRCLPALDEFVVQKKQPSGNRRTRGRVAFFGNDWTPFAKTT